MTKRKDPADLKIRARDDVSVKPRVKKSPAAKARNIVKLRETPMANSIAVIEKQDPNRPLTEKQKLFVKAWASGETILSASYRAGYADSGAMGYRMAKDPAILKIYNFEKAKYEEASGMTRKKVMDMLLEGYETAKLMAEPASMVSAAREIGKMCGYYEPVKRVLDININGDVSVKRLERMSDADLLALMKGHAEDAALEIANEMTAEEEAEDD